MSAGAVFSSYSMEEIDKKIVECTLDQQQLGRELKEMQLRAQQEQKRMQLQAQQEQKRHNEEMEEIARDLELLWQEARDRHLPLKDARKKIKQQTANTDGDAVISRLQR
jgi:hypothetical protein